MEEAEAIQRVQRGELAALIALVLGGTALLETSGPQSVSAESLLDRASTVLARFMPVVHREPRSSAPFEPKGNPSPELRASPNRADQLPAKPRNRGEEP